MSKVKDSELYFLVLHWLDSGPCQAAADALRKELHQRQLLPTVPSLGSSVPPDYYSLRQLFSHVPPSALRELVEESVLFQSEENHTSLAGSLSLLEATGSLSFIPSVRAQLTPSTLAVPPPSCRPNFIQRFLQRECCYPKHPLRNTQLTDNLNTHVYEHLQHNKTIRGHRKAVYCVALDRKQCYVVTGADDGIIKIWNLKMGLLKMTCRGHLSEITDLKINCNDTLFASCSNDGTTRVWSLDEEMLGHHIQAMIGHQNGVTFIAFSPILSSALLSVSLDGTCRLWHAESGIELVRLKPLGQPGHFYNTGAFEKPLDHAIATQRETQFVPDAVRTDVGLTCCAFSPTGEHFAASSQSGICFLWHWDIVSVQESITMNEKTWPDVSPTMELAGHDRCVPLLMFNHQGSSLCTASSNGHVKVWKPRKNGKYCASLKGTMWEERWSFTLPDPLPCPAYNNRRRRSAPECNQIAWSCDDQYIMAAYSCSVIMVWNATNGDEENILYGGHADTPVHVLDAHPTDPKLCFSAGYDGMLILWDVINGRKIISLSSQDTHPGRWRWADPIQFVDGRFQQDGMGIVVSDVAGQFHIYRLDSPQGVIRRTPYDQFFLYDYDKVIISDTGEPIDIESGEPQHIHRTRFSMADILEEPYDPSLQEILQDESKFAQLPAPSDPPETPASLFVLFPTVSAALWLADEAGLGQQARATRLHAAQQRQLDLMQQEGNLDDVANFLPPLAMDDLPEIPEPEIEEESEGSEYTPDEAEPTHSPLATRRSERIQTRTTEAQTGPHRRRIPTRQNPQVDEELTETADEDEDMVEEDVPDFGQILSEVETVVLSETDSSETESEVEISPPESPPRRRGRPHRSPQPERRSTRRRRLNRVVLSFSDEEVPLQERSRAQPTSRARPSERSLRAARRAAAAADTATPHEVFQLLSSPPGPSQGTSTDRPEDSAQLVEVQDPSIIYAHCRSVHAYQWLSEMRRPVGYYVPQVGDQVVYFSTLHERFNEANPLLATQLEHPFVDDVRFAEPCRVMAVRYEIFREIDPSPTVARVTLRLTDDERFGDGCIFDVVVPPPYFGHEEFLISQTLFLKSMHADWNLGQDCTVFYYDEEPEWWKGEIVEDRHQQVQCENLWECEGHYRRYQVQWTDHSNAQPELLSPWELAAVSLGEGPSRAETLYSETLDEAIRKRLLNTLAEAKDRKEAEYFRETLSPEASFPIPGRTRRESRTLFYNHVVPLPLSLKIIKTRLQHPTYYTSLEGFQRDVELIVDNARLFTGAMSPVSRQAAALRSFILRRMELEVDEYETASSEEESSRPKRRRASGLNPYAERPPEGDYQIRTRGRAKRERQPEDPPRNQRTTRRRHCT